MMTRHRKYWYSTEDGIEYSVDYVDNTHPIPHAPLTCRCFMTVTLVEARILLYRTIPCNADTAAKGKQFAADLWSLFPEISANAAARLTETFTAILEIANATHVCPKTTSSGSGLGSATSHFLEFNFHPDVSSRAELDVVMVEGEVVEPEPEPRPATTGSIMELLMASNEVEDRLGECPICMDEMEKARVVKMQCSHWFHRDCLIKWLDKTHSCPLCRYEMPAAHYQYEGLG